MTLFLVIRTDPADMFGGDGSIQIAFVHAENDKDAQERCKRGHDGHRIRYNVLAEGEFGTVSTLKAEPYEDY